MGSPLQFFDELRRRSVFKVAAGYVVSAWLLLQVASIVFPAFELSEWFMRVTLLAVVAGFFLACGLAWVYEYTATGVRRDPGARGYPSADESVERAAGTDEDIASERRRSPSGLAVWEAGTVGIALIVAFIGAWSLYASPAPSPRHLAVLPVRVVSTDPGADVLAAGLTETLTSTVTQFGQFERTLWVVPAAEIPQAMTPSGARQRFGVSHVVSASLQLGGGTGRLTLNLIDAETERQLQSEQITLSDEGVAGLQGEATRRLSAMLNLGISPQDAQRVARGQSADPAARRLYLEGRGLLRHATTTDAVDAAIGRFQEALRTDSTFALAAAGLGEAYWAKYRRTEDVQWVETALHHSQRALDLDSTLAAAWVTLGIMRSDQRHHLAAIDAFEHALALDPGAADAYRHLATVYRRQGNARRAEATYRQAIARQPEYWKGYNLLGVFYYTQGRYDEAVAQYTHGLRLAPANPSLLNNLAVSHWTTYRLAEAMAVFEQLVALDSTRASARSNLATAYFYLGRFDEAAGLYAQSLANDPNDYATAGALGDAQTWSESPPSSAHASYRRAIDLARTHLSVRDQDPDLLGSLAQFYVRIQQPDSARIWLRRLETVVDSSTAGVVTAFTIGELYESLGERDRAWAWMQPALDRGYGWIQVAYSPWLAGLRTDPRIAGILRSHPLADSLFDTLSTGDLSPGPSPPDR